jgi:hypothetical protein
VREDVEQIATLDVEDDVFESDAALRPQLRVLRLVPSEATTDASQGITDAGGQRVALVRRRVVINLGLVALQALSAGC